MGIAITIWSIRLSVMAMFVVWLVRAGSGPSTDSSQTHPVLRTVWLIGALLSILHLLFAFAYYHDWSHLRAYEDTAEKTWELLGIRFGGGVYFNYIFVVLWVSDAVWWLISPRSYEDRRNVINHVVNGYLLFITVNGMIVFEDGTSRYLGIGLLFSLVCCWGWNAKRRSPVSK